MKWEPSAQLRLDTDKQAVVGDTCRSMQARDLGKDRAVAPDTPYSPFPPHTHLAEPKTHMSDEKM